MRAPILLLLLCALCHGAERPNILFIYLDDFGWRDTSYAGSDFYETPHLDRLAAQGMVFSDAYAGAANCAPSRACMLSGQYSPRHEIYNVGTGPRGKSKHRRLKHIPGTNTLRPDIITWAECARKSGYTTATLGKWHLSRDPLPYGFDLNIGGSRSGGPPRGYMPPHGKVAGLGNAPRGEYVTDRLSDEAIRFIELNREKPWLVYLTHFAVHTPLQAKEKDRKYFAAKKPGKLHNHAVMGGMIKSVDDGIGRIIAKLEKLKLKEKTIILFYSDNGGYGPATSMHPLKGYKGTYYEGGIRVPFFVNWPGVVKPASKCSVPITAVDLHPTIRAICGGKLPAGQIQDGVNLLPLFKGQSIAERSIYWHFPAYLQSYQRSDEQPDPLFRARPCGVMRHGDWKLIEYFEDGRLELFNLGEDIGEKRNLAASLPEKTKSMHVRLKSWRSRTRAPVPSEKNPDFEAG
ncbi:MAG: sulfatase [Verrucomicrobiales bacterium]